MFISTSIDPATAQPPKDPAAWNAAKSMESAFLAEMLRMGGLGMADQQFRGGIGEAQFSGLLVDEQARMMVQSGGIGLAEMIYRSLIETPT
jgi:Rod binding domain-containing protein